MTRTPSAMASYMRTRAANFKRRHRCIQCGTRLPAGWRGVRCDTHEERHRQAQRRYDGRVG